MSHEPAEAAGPDRRTVLRRAAVGGLALPLLAACGAGGPAATRSTKGGSGNGDGATTGTTLASTTEVPVGGGIILPDQQVVLTQPAKGEFKAFTAICTHQGCTVNAVTAGKIVCPCHGSEFSIKDGANLIGPAGQPAGSIADLAEVKVSVKRDRIVAG